MEILEFRVVRPLSSATLCRQRSPTAPARTKLCGLGTYTTTSVRRRRGKQQIAGSLRAGVRACVRLSWRGDRWLTLATRQTEGFVAERTFRPTRSRRARYRRRRAPARTVCLLLGASERIVRL